MTVHGQDTARELGTVGSAECNAVLFQVFFYQILWEVGKFFQNCSRTAEPQEYDSTPLHHPPLSLPKENPKNANIFHSFGPKFTDYSESLENIDTFPSSPEEPFSCCPGVCQHWEWLQSCFLGWVAWLVELLYINVVCVPQTISGLCLRTSPVCLKLLSYK